MAEAVAAITGQLRVRVMRSFARSGLIEVDDARQMRAWGNSGFSLERLGAKHRAGLKRRLRPCVWLLHVRFVEHCCRSHSKRRCLWPNPAFAHVAGQCPVVADS